MITIILIIILSVAIGYIIKCKLELRNIRRQMENWKGEQINVKTYAIESEIEKLVVAINEVYKENQEIRADNLKIDRELRRSVANISHDLRTPLTSISGYIQLLKSNETTEDEKQEYIGIIERRAKSLQSLITSFYDLSRLQSSDYMFELKALSLKNILMDNIATYYHEFVAKGFEPKIEIDEQVENIVSDENAVNRIFSNLIGNMIKHSNGDIEIKLEKRQHSIVTEFINDVNNLSQEDVKKLFERFYVKDKSRTNQNTGLGLSITKAFVEQLGNTIEASLVQGRLVIKIEWKTKN